MFPRFRIASPSILLRTLGPTLLILGFLFLLYPSAPVKSQMGGGPGHVFSQQVAANTNSVLVASGSRQLIGLEGFSNSTSVAYVKLYNAATAAAVTCGTGTPQARYLVVGQTTGAGFITMNAPADIYPSGIVACVTGGYADADTTAPAATTFIVNYHWQ